MSQPHCGFSVPWEEASRLQSGIPEELSASNVPGVIEVCSCSRAGGGLPKADKSQDW